MEDLSTIGANHSTRVLPVFGAEKPPRGDGIGAAACLFQAEIKATGMDVRLFRAMLFEGRDEIC